jgi:hypothetical protein
MAPAREDAEKVSFSLHDFIPFLSSITHAFITWFLSLTSMMTLAGCSGRFGDGGEEVHARKTR